MKPWIYPSIIIITMILLSIWKPKIFIRFGMSEKQIREGGFLLIIYGWGGTLAWLLMWLQVAIMVTK